MIFHWRQWKWQTHSALLQEMSLLSLASFCQMPSSHLPRTPCDKFAYDFHCAIFFGIVGGYGLRHMCSKCLWTSCNFFYGARGQPGVNTCTVSAVAVQSPQPLHGNRTEPVRGSAFARCPCGGCAMPPMTCVRATVLRFFQICKTSR